MTATYCMVCEQALGLQEALMDRILMTVMILKEEVEYSKFRTKPFQLLMLGETEMNEHLKCPTGEEQDEAAASSRQEATAAAAATATRLEKPATAGPGAAMDLSMVGADASAVSVASAALAAHMNNPHNLWQRGSATGTSKSKGRCSKPV